MKKANYDKQPRPLEAVGNGSYLYRWNIEQVTQPDIDGNDIVSYQCNEVLIWNKPTCQKVTQAVIEAKWSNDDEKKLINDFNSFNIGLTMDESAKQAYIDFINQRNALRLQVKTDLGV